MFIYSANTLCALLLPAKVFATVKSIAGLGQACFHLLGDCVSQVHGGVLYYRCKCCGSPLPSFFKAVS